MLDSFFQLESVREMGATPTPERGEALLLQRQLVRRFGALPTDIVGRIAAANSAQLEVWGDRVLDADSLEEVFAS